MPAHLVLADLSEMRTADEVALVYAMNGANRHTLAAARTLRVIDSSEVVDNVDRIVGTVLLTLTAGNTAVGARLARFCALCVARALYDDARGISDKVDDRVRTGSRTDTASDAFSRVDPCHTVFNGYSALGTYGNAVTVAEAGKGAELVA